MKEVDRFKELAENMLDNMAAMRSLLAEISTAPNCIQIINILNEVDEQRVTLLEPYLLKVRMDEVFADCNDLSLIEYANRKDPGRTKVTEAGVNWLTYTQELGRVTVDGIKAIRECLDHRFCDIKDGKRIAELIIAGKIK